MDLYLQFYTVEDFMGKKMVTITKFFSTKTIYLLLILAIQTISSVSRAGPSCREFFHFRKVYPVYNVHISKLRPTQMEIGRALVEIRATELLVEAAGINVRPRDYVLKFRNKKPVPAVISPRGEFFITDSHHGISIIYRMLGKTADVKLKIEIVRDYREAKTDGSLWTYEEFIFNLQAATESGGLAKGQFSKDVKNKSPEARFAYLPSRYDMLLDNPLRSLVGAAFTLRGLSPSNYKDYIEFDVAEMINPTLLPDLNFTNERIEQVADFIFSDSAIQEYLMQNLNSQP